MLHWVALGLGLAPSCAALNLPGALLFPSWRPHALALPMQLGITLSNVFFFWCVSEATRAGLASACEVCAAGRSQLTTRNAHPLQASDQCDVTHNSP